MINLFTFLQRVIDHRLDLFSIAFHIPDQNQILDQNMASRSMLTLIYIDPLQHPGAKVVVFPDYRTTRPLTPDHLD